jgi:SNF2 family DNA or RNA helicase
MSLYPRGTRFARNSTTTLTNQVSGVGLNLVGADRAIIVDPDWNPANDNQCIDRVYRIG